LGRGATGFTTRPDLGPGSALSLPPSLKPGEDIEQFEDAEEEQGLLAVHGPQAADDEEADATFAAIEAKMSERRQGRRAIVKEAVKEGDPTTMFASDKLKLRAVTEGEWANLPESGDFIAKRAKKSNEKERYTPVPDSVLLGALGDMDFRRVGESREKVLGARLDMAKVTPGNATSIDPAGYLTSLEAQSISNNQVGDIKRARALLKSAVQTNPQNPAAWISAARIEEVAGNIKQARAVLTDALEACPDSEDIWLEVIRLAQAADVSVIMGKALERLPNSIKLWIKSSESERDVLGAKRVLRKALEVNAASSTLWKALIEREEDSEDARVLLSKAVEFCPKSVELWIAFARLETHENARKVLNRARQLCPLSMAVWLAAARLEDAQGNESIVEKIIYRAVGDLKEKGAHIVREEWLKEARECEKSADYRCAVAIIKATASYELEDDQDLLISTWINDAETASREGCSVVAKTLLELALEKNPTDENVWVKLLAVDNDISAFKRALQACPTSVKIWLEFSARTGDPTVLVRAIETNPESEAIWLAAIKQRMENFDYINARQMLKSACDKLESERIWKKYVKLESRHGDPAVALSIVQKGVLKFPTSPSLWLHMGRLDPSKWEEALRACPRDASVLIAAAEYYSVNTQPIKARAILERGRQLLPENASIWLASTQLETKLNEHGQARALMVRALQKCPTSAELWSMAITMEARPLRKAKAMEALRRCGNSALIYLAVAQLMVHERKFSDAKEYFERAVVTDPSIGDVWAEYLVFTRRNGQPDEVSALEERIMTTKPKNGPKWHSFRNQPQFWNQSFPIIFEAFIGSPLCSSIN
jgi:pre-mRNA-processing factor 6